MAKGKSKSRMKPQAQITIFKTPLAKCWLEPNTLCIISNNVPRTVANLQEHYKIIKAIVRRKVCWLVDFQVCQHFEKDVKALHDIELPNICCALSIIAESPCEKMLASAFLKFEKNGVPVKISNNEKDARLWLQQTHLKMKEQSNQPH